MTSSNNVMIVCSPLQVGKTFANACTVESCQHACASIGIPNLSSLAGMHEPSHEFRNLSSMPVTLSPRYFGVPLYQSLEFIENNILKQCKAMYKNMKT